MLLAHVRAALLGSLAALALFVVAGLPIYVFPQVDEPAKVDVIYVLGLATETRMALADGMLEAGLSETLMISTPDPEEDPLCEPRSDVRVYCLTPEPFTTQGEAQDLATMAADHDWNSALVITFTPHIDRARMLIKRCYTGELRVVEDDAAISIGYWGYQYLYQTGAFIKAALTPGC